MILERIQGDLSLCKIKNLEDVDMEDDLWFLAKTDRELSLVCSTKCVPGNVTDREDGWRALRIQGTLEFDLVGILARIASLLAAEAISIFAVSTYDTDYVLTKKENFNRAVTVLEKNGYSIR